MDDITIYAVRNSEGKWFRRKGYGGYGETWTDQFSLARIYTKIGPARGVVSFFANNYPKYGTPDIVQFHVSCCHVLDETSRVARVKAAKQRQIAADKKYAAERKAKQAAENLKQAIAEYQKICGGKK